MISIKSLLHGRSPFLKHLRYSICVNARISCLHLRWRRRTEVIVYGRAVTTDQTAFDLCSFLGTKLNYIILMMCFEINDETNQYE
jgi:hypothetical protein